MLLLEVNFKNNFRHESKLTKEFYNIGLNKTDIY